MAAGRNVKLGRVAYARRPAPPPKKRRVRPNAKATKLAIKVGVSVLVLIGLWNVFSIQSISVAGSRAIPANDIIHETEQSLGHHPFSRNLLTLGLAPLSQDLLADQRLASVQIKRKWPNKLIVGISARQISLDWRSGSNIYLIDQSGVAVALEASANPSLPLVTDSAGLPVKVGERVAPQQFVQFVLAVASGLTPLTNLVVSSMNVPESTSELYVKTTANYVIKFDTTNGVGGQLANLKLVLATLAKIKKTPTQYIDLRVPNRAYYL